MDHDLSQGGEVAECNVALQQGQDGPTAGLSEGTVLVVGRRAVPAAEAGATGAGKLAGWVVLVVERLEVRGDGGGVGLGEAGKGEWAGDELAGGGVGGWWRLVRVKGAAVVFWGAELVARRGKGRLARGFRFRDGGGWGEGDREGGCTGLVVGASCGL